MTPYVYEFLYRGTDPDDPSAAPAWHVVMRGLDGLTWPGERIFNMSQAEGAGFALPDVIAGINAATLVEADRLRAQLNQLQQGDET